MQTYFCAVESKKIAGGARRFFSSPNTEGQHETAAIRPGRLRETRAADKEGNIRDLSKRGRPRSTTRCSSPRNWRGSRASSPRRCRSCAASPRLGVPYAASASSSRSGSTTATTPPSRACRSRAEPVLFMKATTCLSGPNDDIDHAEGLGQARLGSRARRRHRHQGAVRAPNRKALDHVAGYCVVNDVSERNFQLERGSQWDRGKGCDTFGPDGPMARHHRRDRRPAGARHVARRERREAPARQHAHDDLRRCATWCRYVSQFMTLLPGDIITTGTPPGVALGMKPPQCLKPGDVVTLGIRVWASSASTCAPTRERRVTDTVALAPTTRNVVARDLPRGRLPASRSGRARRTMRGRGGLAGADEPLGHRLARGAAPDALPATACSADRSAPLRRAHRCDRASHRAMDGEDGWASCMPRAPWSSRSRWPAPTASALVGVSATRSHCGAMGLYAPAGRGRGLIGIAMTHSCSIVVPHGGSTSTSARTRYRSRSRVRAATAV